MRILFIIAALFLSGCASQPKTPFEIAAHNFVYVSDIANEFKVYDFIEMPFEGDCEDFAFTLQRRIGGKVWWTYLPGEGAHAVLVKDGIAYDFLKGKMPVIDYPSKMIYWFDAYGNYGTQP